MPVDKKIFKAYDVRGIYPTQINTDSIVVIAQALATVLGSGSVVIARDGRHGGEVLSQTLADEIVAYGNTLGKSFDIIFVGLSTTPMFYFLVNHLNARGGAMITASHNPKEYSGVKAVKEKALPLSGTELLKLIEKNHQ